MVCSFRVCCSGLSHRCGDDDGDDAYSSRGLLFLSVGLSCDGVVDDDDDDEFSIVVVAAYLWYVAFGVDLSLQVLLLFSWRFLFSHCLVLD